MLKKQISAKIRLVLYVVAAKKKKIAAFASNARFERPSSLYSHWLKFY